MIFLLINEDFAQSTVRRRHKGRYRAALHLLLENGAGLPGEGEDGVILEVMNNRRLQRALEVQVQD
jgi:hypothetical protein